MALSVMTLSASLPSRRPCPSTVLVLCCLRVVETDLDLAACGHVTFLIRNSKRPGRNPQSLNVTSKVFTYPVWARWTAPALCCVRCFRRGHAWSTATASTMAATLQHGHQEVVANVRPVATLFSLQHLFFHFPVYFYCCC